MYALKAYRQLRQRGYDCRLLIAGTGPQDREVRRYIATRRLTGVELLGRISDADKIRYFATADIYVSPATGAGIDGCRAARGAGVRHADRVQRHPRLSQRRPPRRAGPARAAARRQRARRRARPAAVRCRQCASGWASRRVSAPSSSAGTTSPRRSRSTTSSSLAAPRRRAICRRTPTRRSSAAPSVEPLPINSFRVAG